jgi:hypothetical protein
MLDWNLPALRFRRAGTLALYAPWARASIFGTGLATNIENWLSSPSYLQAIPPGGVGPREVDRRALANAGAQVDVRLQLLTQTPLTFSFAWAAAFEHNRLPTRGWMASLKVL